jgi:hypothetical protein
MSFTISFSFRDQTYIASVYQASESSFRYSIYFTDVDLILEFGPKVEFTYDSQLHISKEIDQRLKNLLQDSLNHELNKAA